MGVVNYDLATVLLECTMVRRSVLIYAVLIFVTTATSCPDPGRPKWETKDLECSQQVSPGAKYHCQSVAGNQFMVELCALPVNCSLGTHAQLDQSSKTVSCVRCSPDMYQPTAKPSYKFIQPNCDYRKTRCKTDRGELQCGEATTSQDYQCKCDHTQGFKPNNIESKCDCFVKDSSTCECQKAYCTEGEVLASNFSCITNVPITTTEWIAVPVIGGIIAIAAAVIVIYSVRRWKRRNAEMNESPQDVNERTKPSELLKENATDNEKSEKFPLVSGSEGMTDNEDTPKQEQAEDGRSSRTFIGVRDGEVKEANISGITSGGQFHVEGDMYMITKR